MAPSTESLLTRLLMLEAVPNSSANILATLDIWSLGGMISEIILVPLLYGEKGSNVSVYIYIGIHTKVAKSIGTSTHFQYYVFKTISSLLVVSFVST